MASSGNFCTWNPLNCSSSLKFNTGNLSTDQDTNNWMTMFGTMGVKSGKWYWESYQNANNANNAFATGIQETEFGNDGSLWTGSGKYIGRGVSTYGYSYAIYTNAPTYSAKRHNDSQTDTDLSAGTSGDIYQLAVDLDNGKIWFGKNNTWADSGDPANGTNEAYSSIPTRTYVPASTTWNSSGSDNFIHNFGQDSTFGGAVTAGSNADGNGYGDFKYSPPSEFLALCTANLPISENIDPAETSDNYPAKNFNAVLYTGNASTNAISGLGFQPDLFWFNRRSNSGTYGNGIVDSSRGAGLGLYPNRADADTTFTSDFASFDSDGFTLNAGSSANINNSGQTFVAWCWKANGGTTTSFTASGDRLAGTYQANTNSKFSIITYTGNATADAEVLHGLGTTPNFIIFKARSNTHWWGIYLKSGGTVHTGYDSLLYLNSSNALASSQAVNIAPDSTKIVFSGNEQINTNAATYVMYAWADNEMQKFGKYEGNGDANGAFVYTGFRPRMLILKDLDDAENWVQFDSARNTFNPVDKGVFPNSTAAETTGSGSGFDVDFLSNGFKLRCTHDNMNGSSTYVYACWGDVPFKYNNTF